MALLANTALAFVKLVAETVWNVKGVEPTMSVRQAHKLSHGVKEKIRAAIPSVQDVLIHIEPFDPQSRPAFS